jgi:glycosyltransferase involved in cell wall biosynthesis
LPDDWQLKCLAGKGNYCLYQGDLSVDTNEKAAVWLLQKVFNEIKLPFVIAGKNPSKKLIRLAHAHNHTCIVANPGDKEMQDMISKAHINILPSYSSTGIKLKLLNALFNGRYCLVNNATVEGSELDSLCLKAGNAETFKKMITELHLQSFTSDNVEQRKALLRSLFNNEANAKQQVKWIWGE